MNNLACVGMGKTSIATTGYMEREQGTIASDGVFEGSYGKGSLTSVEAPFFPAPRPAFGQVIHIGLDDLVFPSLFAGITTARPYFWTETALESEGVRGVFTLKHRRNLLFSQEIELRIADLPRRKPRVNFDRLAFDTDD